jgi:hypothetical protein
MSGDERRTDDRPGAAGRWAGTRRYANPEGHADAGRVSVFLAIALFAVVVIIGLVVDGATRLGAMQVADNLAAEAARAGGQSINQAQAIDGGPKEIDEAAATRAVADYLAAANVDGPPAQFPVVDGEKLIKVEVTFSYEPVMLSFFGWDTIEIRGEATARLLTEP